jgi:hypothetical protein
MVAPLAHAEPIAVAGCTTDSASLTRFAPCTLGGKLFSDFHAELGGVDVTASPFLAATTDQDVAPGEPISVPILAIPQFLPVTPDNPLTLSFRVATIDALSRITGTTVQIQPFSQFDGLLRVQFEGGPTPVNVSLGTDPLGNPLGQKAFVSLPAERAYNVIATLNQPAPLGGAFGFVFETTNASTVPEPATMALVATGLAFASRMRRRTFQARSH